MSGTIQAAANTYLLQDKIPITMVIFKETLSQIQDR